MPNYNNDQFIGDAIKSILSQDYENFELIIVDDGSKDNSGKVIESFADHRVKLYRNPQNIGRVKNINRCLSLATGEYVTILASDSMMAPHSISKRVEVLENNNDVGLVFSSILFINENGAVTDNFLPFGHPWVLPGEEVFKSLIMGNYIFPIAAMVRNSCYNTLGTFREDIGMGGRDWHMWLRIALHYKIAFINEPLALNREHRGNSGYHNILNNMVGMNDYAIVKTIFREMPDEKRHLLFLENQALKAIAHRMLKSAGRNLANGNVSLARKNLGLALAVDDRVLKNWRLHFLLFATLTGKTMSYFKPTIKKVKRNMDRILRGGKDRKNN